jgi:hypothetical protein
MADAKASPIDPRLNPLVAEDLTDLKKAKDILSDVIASTEAAEQCGTDCQQFRSLVEMLGARIDAMNTTYFSNPGV